MKEKNDEKLFLLHVKSSFRYIRYFCFDFFDRLTKGFDKKFGLISKFMTSQTEQQIITLNILSNISSSKGSRTMKFYQ